MENNIKLTKEQIDSMRSYISTLSSKGGKTNLMFMYNPLTPKDVYVKFTNYSVSEDNSIYSKEELICIDPQGKNNNCDIVYMDFNQRLGLERNMIEFDLDANGKIVF
jgi:hypothetical protein